MDTELSLITTKWILIGSAKLATFFVSLSLYRIRFERLIESGCGRYRVVYQQHSVEVTCVLVGVAIVQKVHV